MEHRLNVTLGSCLSRQKLRMLRGDWKEATSAKIKKLKQARFIRPVRYPKWLFNIIMARKADNGWCMCIDFTNLNAVCPKDICLLPSIDQLVYKSSTSTILSFMDAHSGITKYKWQRKTRRK